MNKKTVLISLVALTIFTIGLNLLYTNWKQPKIGIAIIDTDGSSSVIYTKDFEAAKPRAMSVTLTRKNGEKIPKEYYGVSLLDLLKTANVKSNFEKVVVTASDHFEASFTADELEDDVYLSYSSKDDIYEVFVLKDEFSTRFVRNIKQIALIG